MRIMIVEDEYLVARDLERILRLAGHEIIGPAATAESAYGLAGETKLDLALLDIRLSDGSTGPAVAPRLWDRHRVPSLFVSGIPTDNPAYTHAALGALTKPVSSLVLLRSIEVTRRIMSGEPLWRHDVPAELRLFGQWVSDR
jgi:DNA-binding response OmpR family regulator